VRSRQLAEEVAQSVFTDLARTASRLAPDTIVTAWLYQVTRRTAIDVVRREARRQLREQIATELNAMNTLRQLSDPTNGGTESAWPDIEPLLDESVSALDEPDRTAILLRYFENKSLREVGQTLGVSDDTAQKRVSRAVERLREFLSKRGVQIGASGLAVAISANAVQAAPLGLALTISTAVLAGTSITATTLITQTTMNWLNLKSTTAIIAAAVVAGTGTHLVQQRETNRLRSENQTLIDQQAKLTAERDKAVLATEASSDERNRTQADQNELLRLRGEVGLLRRQSQELDRLKAQNQELSSSLAEAAKALQAKTPETESDLFKQVAIAKLNDAKQLVLSLMMYAADNQNQLPAGLNQSSKYLGSGDSILTGTNQFELVLQGSLTNLATPASTIVVREKEAWFAGGKWQRTYGFADGHSEVHSTPDGNFEPWEQQHMVLPPSAGR